MPFDPSAPATRDSGVFGLCSSEDQAAVVLVPVPWEATTSYGRGAAGGPAAILSASRQIDLFDVETGHPYRSGIYMQAIPEQLRALDRSARANAEVVLCAGGVRAERADLLEAATRVNAACDEMVRLVEENVARLLERRKYVGLVGGDHSTAYGSIRAHSRVHEGMGVLHVDAHADLRSAYEGFTWSHASIMHNVAERLPAISRLVQVGIRDLCEEEKAAIDASGGRIVTHFDPVLAGARFEGESWGDQVQRIVADLPDEVYVSFDIDGLDPALCPHTGTPVPGGLSFQQATHLLAGVVRSGRRIVGFDLVEVAPGPDGDEWDGNVGARMLYKMIGWMVADSR